MLNSLLVIFPELILISLGFVLANFTKLNRSVWEQLDKFIYYFLFPILLFRSVSKSDSNLVFDSHFIISGVLLAILSSLVVFIIPNFIRKFKYDSHFKASAQIAFRFNSFLAISIANSLADVNSLLYMSLLIGVNVPIFNTVAVWFMSDGKANIIKSLGQNPLIIGTVFGLLVVIFNLQLPSIFTSILDRIAVAAIPLGIMAVGAGIKLRFIYGKKLLSIYLLFCKHLLTPLIALALIYMFSLNKDQALVILIFASLPTATSCYILAKNMGYKEAPYVASLITISTIFGILSITLSINYVEYYF